MVVKGNCFMGGIQETEFEGKKYFKVQLLDGAETLMAKVDSKLRDELAKLPRYSNILCELQVKDYGSKTGVQLVSAVTAKQ